MYTNQTNQIEYMINQYKLCPRIDLPQESSPTEVAWDWKTPLALGENGWNLLTWVKMAMPYKQQTSLVFAM